MAGVVAGGDVGGTPPERSTRASLMDPKEGDYVRFKHMRVETTGTVIKRFGAHVRVQPKDGGATLWKELMAAQAAQVAVAEAEAEAEAKSAGELLEGMMRIRGGMGAGASALTDESPDADIKAAYEGASAQERSVFLVKVGDQEKKKLLFWLMGGGGTGKSVLTAELLDRVIHRAVAWHFCRHDNPA
eukprot:jgi/Chrpa1/5722/Chrysochromulina_OHIO_Genome00002008-RA